YTNFTAFYELPGTHTDVQDTANIFMRDGRAKLVNLVRNYVSLVTNVLVEIRLIVGNRLTHVPLVGNAVVRAKGDLGSKRDTANRSYESIHYSPLLHYLPSEKQKTTP